MSEDRVKAELQAVVDESIAHLHGPRGESMGATPGASAISGAWNLLLLIPTLVKKLSGLVPPETIKALILSMFDNTLAKLDWPWVDGVEELQFKASIRALIVYAIDAAITPTPVADVALNSALAKLDELRASLPA